MVKTLLSSAILIQRVVKGYLARRHFRILKKNNEFIEDISIEILAN